MIPDIVEIKRLCASGQWFARIENGKILLHDTVAGETVCIGQTDYEPVRHGRWIPQDATYTRFMCSACKSRNHAYRTDYCPDCGAKMDAEERERYE